MLPVPQSGIRRKQRNSSAIFLSKRRRERPSSKFATRVTSHRPNFERYQRIAPFYDLLDLPFEYGRYRALRPQLFVGLSGRILDAGVGTGRNLPFYPPGAVVVGIDLSPTMLARAARRRASSRAASVDLCVMDVTRLDFPTASFDAAAATFLFCVLADELQPAALRELVRVVKPGGPIRLLEYVRPRGAVRRFISQLWAPWIAWAYGARFDRRTEAHIREAGLAIASSRYVVPDLIKLIEVRAAP
ncbi:MAG: class I SAM-dependent methyltransferase [Alphaproteobacteria bacterium]|nr:class I SAM-dependent methyltransferase [Alphaproteobacteria bacterium]